MVKMGVKSYFTMTWEHAQQLRHHSKAAAAVKETTAALCVHVRARLADFYCRGGLMF